LFDAARTGFVATFLEAFEAAADGAAVVRAYAAAHPHLAADSLRVGGDGERAQPHRPAAAELPLPELPDFRIRRLIGLRRDGPWCTRRSSFH